MPEVTVEGREGRGRILLDVAPKEATIVALDDDFSCYMVCSAYVRFDVSEDLAFVRPFGAEVHRVENKFETLVAANYGKICGKERECCCAWRMKNSAGFVQAKGNRV
ncbi:hypothetical protein M569_02876 [Genlisea aurea]|uniref:Uncharacterized protein n=1 Tax=Genlisea aurea TaxID=192259 RepID=S8EGV5_9LAMI|nr:hypothetical protein M569_02876 [Genlisea aurea]